MPDIGRWGVVDPLVRSIPVGVRIGIALMIQSVLPIRLVWRQKI